MKRLLFYIIIDITLLLTLAFSDTTKGYTIYKEENIYSTLNKSFLIKNIKIKIEDINKFPYEIKEKNIKLKKSYAISDKFLIKKFTNITYKIKFKNKILTILKINGKIKEYNTLKNKNTFISKSIISGYIVFLYNKFYCANINKITYLNLYLSSKKLSDVALLKKITTISYIYNN